MGHCKVCFYYLFIVHILTTETYIFNMCPKHVSKSVHVEAAFGENIKSVLKLILKFAILAKPNQQNKSVFNHNKNTSKL